jgi:hypothetical protein
MRRYEAFIVQASIAENKPAMAGRGSHGKAEAFQSHNAGDDDCCVSATG